jgi:hypothetical protein
VFLGLFLGVGGSLRAQAIDTLVLRDVARALAHDSLLGRDTGSEGERKAAHIIAARLKAIGISPLDSAGFTIPLPLLRLRLDPASRIIVHTARDSAVFVAERDFTLHSAGRGGLRPMRGPAVYVDDVSRPAMAGQLDGRVIVTAGPMGEQTRDVIRSWIQDGVAGVILPVPSDSQFAAFQRSGAGERLIVDYVVDEPVWQPDLPVIVAGPALSRALFVDLTPVRDDTARVLDLNRTVDAQLSFQTTPVPAANIAGLVRGRDPAVRHEVVILTAHYDHLGVGRPVRGDSIYNGFSDNAAGVAMLLVIAHALQADPPDRSVLFLFTSGEERGLLGSAYWTAKPPVPLDHTVAVLNLDAGAPPAPPVRWRVAGDTLLPAVSIAAGVVIDNGWTADVTPANANSDHWPFMDRGVPTVFLVPGRDWQGLSTIQRDALHAQWDRYHQPGDEWRPGFPMAGLKRYAELALEIARRFASAQVELRR